MYWKDRDHPESDEIPIILPNVYLKKAIEGASGDSQLVISQNPEEVLEPSFNLSKKSSPKKKKEDVVLYFNNESSKSLNDLDAEEIKMIKKTPLFKELKEYRTRLAEEQKVPSYVIMYDGTFIDIVLKMPQTKEELVKIHGFSERKYNKYGEDVLAIINKHR